jgi:hypothetical protein
VRNYKSRIARLEGKRPLEEQQLVLIIEGVIPGESDREPNHFQCGDIHNHEGESKDEFIARVQEQVENQFIMIFATRSD